MGAPQASAGGFSPRPIDPVFRLPAETESLTAKFSKIVAIPLFSSGGKQTTLLFVRYFVKEKALPSI